MVSVCGFAVVRLFLAPRLPFYSVGRAFVVGLGVPPFRVLSFFFCLFLWGGGLACSSLCHFWVDARTGRHSVWLTGLPLVLKLAAGRAPAPWVGWVMYALGLGACPVGLGSGFAGQAVAPAGFVWSSVKRGWGCPRPPAFGL